MSLRLPSGRSALAFAGCLPWLLLWAGAPVQAQYKIVGSDGKVTYTDRTPSQSEGRVTALGARAAASAPEVELPFELRRVVNRYPVTLFVTSGACEPCESGRTLLRQRGIPYTEKQVLTGEDSEALEKLSGGREAPTLTIGSQIVRGLAPDLWNGYLDAAGYPRESKLPSAWQPRPATPLVERREAAVAPAPQRPAAPEASPFDRLPATSGGIRF